MAADPAPADGSHCLHDATGMRVEIDAAGISITALGGHRERPP